MKFHTYAIPTRAVVIVGQMDASLLVETSASLDDAMNTVRGLANMTESGIEAYRRWVTSGTRRAGDAYEVEDETGDTVCCVVLV